MDTQLRTVLKSFIVTCAVFALLLLVGIGWARAGGAAALTNPPGLTIKQRADQLVAMTKGGYHTALFSTTPKEKFSFASGTNAPLGSSAPKGKFAFASRARVAVDEPPCNTICRLVVVQYPDLTPLVTLRPSVVYGTTDMTIVVDVVEVNGVATTGQVTVKIPKDPKITLSFSSTATKVNNRSVKNSAWTFSGPSGGFYTLTTNQGIAAGDVLSFGLTGSLTPGATTGVLTATSIIVGGSGGELQVDNNNDADKVDYFPQ